MMVPSRAQAVVIGPRRGVALNTGPCPVIERLAQPSLASVPHVDEEGALAAPFGHRRDAVWTRSVG